MSSVRRRVLRPIAPEHVVDPAIATRLARQREKLAKAKTSLKRWMTRLKRATNTVTALHQSITRLEAALCSS
ncbi:hypothetical protein ETAA8_37840 [Anatilimnocola aggregata]|uniref:Uncharacterized protein n=1 Tax=Anatilimnocola aggregata TaxID=2528021 RepID=A0A517YEP9_9BACT|nr:hypothetical protein [Anatilimnocola aggregata]QDU28681.1 hypothetical protein ETAA8_37840 [Anatilimnocola aggregata]